MFLENEKRKKKSDPKSLLFTHYPLQPQCSQNWLIITCFSDPEIFHYLEPLHTLFRRAYILSGSDFNKFSTFVCAFIFFRENATD